MDCHFKLREIVPHLLFVWLLGIQAAPIYAQSVLDSRVLTTADGLADRLVTDIHRDEHGFLWLIGPRGLQRYDGHQFRSYAWVVPDSLQASFSTVRHFHPDPQGWLWIVQREGRSAVKFDPITEQVVVLQAPVVLPTTGEERRICSTQFPFYDVVKGPLDATEQRDRIDAALLDDEVRAIQRTADGQLWIHGRHGRMFLWDPADPDALPVPVPWERWRKGNWPLLGPDAVIWLPDTGRQLRPFQLPRSILDEPGILLHIDDLGETWLTTLDNRLYKINEGSGMLVDHGVQPGTVQRVHRDQEGLAWVGTEAGLVCLLPGQDLFRSIGTDTREGGILSVSNSVRGILTLRDGQSLWFNDRGRLFLTASNGISTLLEISGPSEQVLFIQDLFHSKAGALWILADGDLHLIDAENMQVAQTMRAPGRIRSVHPSPDGARCLLFLQDGRAMLFDPHEKNFGTPFNLPKALNAAVWFDRDQVILPSSAGIRIFNIRTGSTRSLDLQLPRPLQEDMVRSMEFLGPTLFMATGAGVLAVDTIIGKVIRSMSYADGLADEVAYSLLPEQGRLWVGTRNGLSLVNTTTWECINFLKEDGLPFNEFNAGAVLVDPQGQCWMGGVNGWVVFDPEQVSTVKRDRAMLNLSLVRNYDERSGLWRDLGKDEKFRYKGLVLAPHARTVTISFMLAALFNPQANRYSFYMEGHEPAWFHTGAVPRAEYLDLPPGKYVFRVKAYDHRGGLAANEISLPITVLQVWYLRTWAIALWIFLGVAAIVFLVRMEFRRRLQLSEAERIRELDAFKDRFFANVTHEFRTPITVIQGIAGQLENNGTEDPSVHAKAAVIRRNGQRLLGLVDRILDLTRLEHHRLTLDKKPGHILAYLRHALPAYRSLAEVHGLQLDVEISGDDVHVLYDAEHLGQIIDNLIGNALKFTPSGGTVTARASFEEGSTCRLLLEISDTGPGISAADKPRIFDRFFQSSTNDRAVIGGTGIGLALVKELVTAMKGEIEVADRATGGTTFTIGIPMDRAADLPAPEVIPTPSPNVKVQATPIDHTPLNENAPVILVVEDDVDVGDHIAVCIKREYRVLRAMDGLRGVALAFEEVPDLILSDVMMPGLDGFGLCEQLKSDPRTSHIPIALLTARADQPSRLHGITRGADSYLAKPFDERELRGVLANLMRLQRKVQEHYKEVWERSVNADPGPSLVPLPSNDPPPASSQLGEDIEDVFLIRVREILEKNHSDPDYSIERLAEALHLSRSQAFRKIKSLTGNPPLVLLRDYRLSRARSLLEKGGLNVSEVAYTTGFSSPNYFSNAFFQVYGHRPSEVVKH